MFDLYIAVSLWCSTPNGSWGPERINKCREKLSACVVLAVAENNLADGFLKFTGPQRVNDCFAKQKVGVRK